jgi:thioredoxin reductase
MLDTVIIGAGPYGLSTAAHFRHRGIPFRIFGRPMDSWLAHMPKGMKLKSDGFASNIYDPAGEFTLEKFCAERGIEYAHVGIPVHIDTFTSYGIAFMEHMVPELEDKVVVGIETAPEGFAVTLSDGEIIKARHGVLAVGITHFEFTPSNLSHLPAEYLTHSAAHRDLGKFRGRSVIVLGGGASATDTAALLREAGADVQIVARQKELKFHNKPSGKKRSLWDRIRNPMSGLGPGMKSAFYSNYPNLFRLLPLKTRLEIVRTHLGPSGGWFIKDSVIGKMPLSLGYTPERAEVRGGKVVLELRGQDGSKKEVSADHVIAATGYKVDLERLKFLSPAIRTQLRGAEEVLPVSSNFESRVPGLYFIGVAAATSFGPLMRFAFGAGFAARTVTNAIGKNLPHGGSVRPAPAAVPAEKEETEVISTR